MDGVSGGCRKGSDHWPYISHPPLASGRPKPCALCVINCDSDVGIISRIKCALPFPLQLYIK